MLTLNDGNIERQRHGANQRYESLADLHLSACRSSDFLAAITARLTVLCKRGVWRPAPAAQDGARGLYLDEERQRLFCFLVDNSRQTSEPGFARGFMLWRDRRELRVRAFLYQYLCDEHRAVGASYVTDLTVPDSEATADTLDSLFGVPVYEVGAPQVVPLGAVFA